MAPDAGIPATTARQKTLDDIRREIDAEFAVADSTEVVRPPSRGAPRTADVARRSDLEAAALVDIDRLAESDRPSRWRGYVVAGAIGCIVGQLLILGYVGVVRYGGDVVALRRITANPPASPPPSTLLSPRDTATVATAVRTDSRVATAPPAPVAQAEPAADSDAGTAPPSAPSAPASSTLVVPHVDTPSPSAAQAESPASAPPADTAVKRAATARTERGAVPPSVSRLSSPPAVAPIRPLVGPADWVKAQAQLRSALGEWLALSQSADSADMSHAEVILGADGWTAKTRVPTRLGGRTVVREQHWELGTSGWSIVADRYVGQAPR